MKTPSPARPTSQPDHPRGARLGLGLDAGGTQTRWALACGGDVLAEGHVAGLSGLQLGSAAGRADLGRNLAALAEALAPFAGQGAVVALHAGVTGLPDSDAAGIALMKQMLAQALGLDVRAIQCQSDIGLAWAAAFDAELSGYLIYAGTGSIAAFVDDEGLLHRAGGRGLLLGDEGSGAWIATQALAELWRMEDAAPGRALLDSAMARALFEALGAQDWASTRAKVYGAERGELGKLALAVAAAAEQDERAALLLRRAGRELARLGLAMWQRFGPRPIKLAGRVWSLSPLIEQGLRQELLAGLAFSSQAPHIELQQLQPHRHAAQAALAAASGLHTAGAPVA